MAALGVVLLLGLVLPAAAEARGYASIVVDAASGRIVSGRHIDTRLYPASMTKMMTLYMLFEALDQGKLTMNSRLRVSTRAAGQPASKLGLRAGSTIRVRDAILALVTKSANDVATVVAEALGGTESRFARMMTEQAHRLGMSRTTFRNASGLPNSAQKSTARDMAILALSLQTHFPRQYRLFSTTSFRLGGRTIGTHNHLLKRYPGADGLKTGYIRASGFNIAFSARRNGRRLVGVVFGGRSARSRDDHMAKLMDAGFATVAHPTYVSFGADGRHLRVVARSDLSSGVAPRPPILPPGKTVGPQVASPQGASPQVVSLSATVPPVPTLSAPLTPARAGAMVPLPAARPILGAAGPAAGPVVVSLPRPAAAAAPAPSAATEANPGGRWGIQVGAFGSQGAAERVAHEAARLLAGRMNDVRVRVIPHTVDDGRLYRARLVGMVSEGQARGACDTLKARGGSCLVVVPTGWTVAAR
ncbi:D-alanyl-D-alanine carboxypeptidase [Roseospira visakhapatnamensis]|uniref:D-alanyl-D-alanine carboxypeptidase n=1 Tax=Roseospira visakhapatnamensis TaxID=390880 RepID=A0A7W6R9S9_9PROT|nr:D-alanyl-D-alanine carboxypeptidase [Roseospira visakhapatnamensis]MBB4264549.1 D-alanyl-D-alanine carboxypeptidase [Roseospira visakhapatnamensis]